MIIAPMYQTRETLWTLRKAILREKFYLIFGYIKYEKLQNVKEGYATFSSVDDHLSNSSLDAAVSEFENLNIKDFNLTLTDWLAMPYDIRNQLIESIRRVFSEKTQAMNDIVNSQQAKMPGL